jgi:signal peptidase I
MFAPRWKKEARLLHKGAKKFLNYKRDLLEEEKVTQIEDSRAALLKAIKASDKEGVKTAEKLVTQACEKALPRYRRPNAIEENIEVFFVAIVIALGIRAYFLQPFRIPTGSMQPTLNGIIGHPLPKKDFPALPVKAWEAVVSGKKYIHKQITGSERRYLRFDPNAPGRPWISQGQKLQFFTVTTLHFEDGVVKLGAPETALKKMGFETRSDNKGWYVPANTTVSGFTTSGDLVLVDKVSYNFRRPKRGEVWVFDTRGIDGIKRRARSPQGAGSHYIKRLAGTPGDEVRIVVPPGQNAGDLYIDGKPAEEKWLRAVMRGEGRFDGEPGYSFAQPAFPHLTRAIDSPDDVVNLAMREDLLKAGKDNIDSYLHREYFALGDNTDDSQDSRYWGSVKEFNVVGPALFSLWPFTSGHWGLIK